MLASRIETLNPSVTSDAFFKQKLVIGHDYNHLYDDVAALSAKKLDVEEVATTVLTASDSGKVFFVDAASISTQYTLPSPVAGLTFTWVWVADNDYDQIIITNDLTDTTGDMLMGGLLLCCAATNNLFIETAANINCVALDNDTANQGGGIGSWVEVTCVEDAVWSITGVVNNNANAGGDGSELFTNQT